LDEATASLDAENESKIQRALSELIKNKTVLIIAHRMRTVLGADKIIVIKDGEIAEMGTPLELKEKQGIFASMLKTQLQCN
jgi:ATP-binding cassette subfamily B protein